MTDGWIRQVQIRWTGAHHPTDEDVIIDSQLEAGGDEGPLLALLVSRRRDRSRSTLSWVFENVLWYKSHLAEHRADVLGERWVGIAHWSDRGVSANAAMQALARLVDPATGRPLGRSKAPKFIEKPMAEPAPLTEPVLVRNGGDAFDEVQQVYPSLRGLMILLPSGNVDYGPNVERLR
jgi:hypothetical protein